MTVSGKELFMKKLNERDQKESERETRKTTGIDNYRKGMFELGKQVDSWLSGVGVSVKNEDRELDDESAQKVYRINHIELKSGKNTINIIPTGCFNISPRNFGARIILNGKEVQGDIYMNEDLTWDLIDVESTYKTSKKFTYSALDEDEFFKIIGPIASA